MTIASAAATAMTGLSGYLSTQQNMENAKVQANAENDQAALNAQNLSRETELKAGSVQTRFLASGLQLNGTPAANVQGIYSTGVQDINQTLANADAQAKNIYTAARSKSIDTIASSAKGLGLGGLNLDDPFASSTPQIDWTTPTGSTIDTGASQSVLWNPVPGIKQVG